MADKAIAKGFVASAVSSGVIEEPSMPGHVNAIGNGRVAQTRDALELSKLSLELNQLEADVLSPDELRTKKQHEREKSLLELNKLHRDDAYEQQKNEIELQRLKREAIIAGERHEYELEKLRRDTANEQEKSDLEMRKLREETRNARRSQYFEFCKVVVPAVSIVATVAVAAHSLTYQRDKDRSVEVSKQLVDFQNQIVTDDIKKQRNAIAAVRSLRKDAIPSLLANLDVSHNDEMLLAVQAAVLELNEDPALQQTILREVLNSIKYVALRPNLAHMENYLALWAECLRQYQRNPELFQRAVASAEQLATDLNREIQSKNWDLQTLSDVKAAIRRFQSQR
jgi:hypothetical protein